ncbi:MAG: hypothetical protein QT03_C0001G0797 [archaeon GW2011_AR10]|nr:MAG: hypothetical protein QT03_C0001G0797 [archaeon GW2011_AR10]
MTQFSSVVKKSKHRVFYFDIPSQIMNSMELKPFVACKMKAEKKQITLFDFQKTFKIKLDLDRKTINIAKIIMKEEGYGSLDETISNVIKWYFAKLKGKKIDYHTVYIYPEGFLDSKYILIDDYEKGMDKVKKSREKNKKSSAPSAKK